MKLFILLLILITFTSCDFNPLGSGDAAKNFTRLVIVQTMNGTRCTNARLKKPENDYFFRANDNGEIAVRYNIYHDGERIFRHVTVYRDTSDAHEWSGHIECFRGSKYKEFYITFPNF